MTIDTRTTNKGTMRSGGFGIVPLIVIALGGFVACEHPDRQLLSGVTGDRHRPAVLSGPSPISLAQHTLLSHKDFDKLETDVERRGGLSRLLPLYEALVAEQPENLRLGVRTVLLQLRAGGQGRLQKAIPLVESLRTRAPEDPDVLFALGSIKRIVLFDPTSRAFFVGPEQIDIARKLLEDWQRLLQVAPEYEGSHGEGAAALRQQVAALQKLLAEPGEAKSPASAVPEDAKGLAELIAFLDARETQVAERGCAAGRKALRQGGEHWLPELDALVQEVCGRSTR